MNSLHMKEIKIFKALGDENRIKILEILKDGEKCACKLLEELQISQSTLSHHMKILCDSGIVFGRKEGKWMHYSIIESSFDSVFDLLSDFAASAKLNADNSCGCEK